MGWTSSSRLGVAAVTKWGGVGAPIVNLVFPISISRFVKSAGSPPKGLIYVKNAGQTRLRTI